MKGISMNLVTINVKILCHKKWIQFSEIWRSINVKMGFFSVSVLDKHCNSTTYDNLKNGSLL